MEAISNQTITVAIVIQHADLIISQCVWFHLIDQLEMKGFVIFSVNLWLHFEKNTQNIALKTPCEIWLNCMGILSHDLQDSGTILRDH